MGHPPGPPWVWSIVFAPLLYVAFWGTVRWISLIIKRLLPPSRTRDMLYGESGDPEA